MREVKQKPRVRPIVLAGILAWLLLIMVSAGWNIAQARESQLKAYLHSARSFFKLIVTTREWNARHGGVYLPVSDDIQPNPYLDVPNRDITTTNGIQLTLINPAYMTRLIAELADQQNNVRFHITSLKPIRPANAPEAWEAKALTAFEQEGDQEFYQYYEDGSSRKLRYMAPLFTMPSCLKCHSKQGYHEGDIRGGISVTLPIKLRIPWALIMTHIFLAVAGSVLIFKYGTKLDRAVRELAEQSITDPLTGVYNRRYLFQAVHREVERAAAENLPLSIMMLDLDHFKLVNDTYGHSTGDQVLRAVAECCHDFIHDADIIGRYGGDEFLCLFPGTNLVSTRKLAEQLRQSIANLTLITGAGRIDITASIGIASLDGTARTTWQLIAAADTALYEAKQAGRNRVRGP